MPKGPSAPGRCLRSGRARRAYAPALACPNNKREQTRPASGLAQTQRRSSPEPRQPRDDRIPPERSSKRVQSRRSLRRRTSRQPDRRRTSAPPRLRESPMCLLSARSAATCKRTWLSLVWRAATDADAHVAAENRRREVSRGDAWSALTTRKSSAPVGDEVALLFSRDATSGRSRAGPSYARIACTCQSVVLARSLLTILWEQKCTAGLELPPGTDDFHR